MHTLRRQLDAECPSAASFAAKETWSDEIIQVPNGDACLSADGEKCQPSQNRAFVLGKRTKQPRHSNERSVQQTVVTCVPEVITENDDSQDPSCESSMTSSRSVGGTSRRDGEEGLSRQWQDRVNLDVQFEMSRQGAPTRMTTRPGLTTSVIAKCDTRKAGKAPQVPRTGQSKVRNWSRGAH